MPVFQCVQCFDCSHFQSTQTRKDKKFSCKLCGKKQSVRKVIAQSGSGAEVRKVVQRLNLARGTAQEAYDEQRAEQRAEEYDRAEEYTEEGSGEYAEQNKEMHSFVDPSQSRWRDLAHAADIAEGKYGHPAEKEDEFEEDDAFVTAVPDLTSYSKKRGRQFKKPARTGIRTENSNIPAVGGVGRRNSRKIPDMTYAVKNQLGSSLSRQPLFREKNTRPSGTTKANTAIDDDVFTTTGADVAFEEEVMP